ncbi:rRNA maturation RNase YbeY [Candidatus Parcubacteria bacterium]|nr:rRNA maturation RNase YbeY [Candidatus Parcubacteria bacterium]
MDYIEKDNLEITRQTKGLIPIVPFSMIKNEILGKKYDLSLAFTTMKDMRSLSKKHKGNYNHLNTLAFPFDENSGEIAMNLQTIRSQAKDHDKKYLEFLIFLFIHSSLHLKGYKHGSEMEKLEEKYFKKFNK